MTTDSFFQQGESHEVCEDYAVHGPGYVVVSDGCSNGGLGSIHSDWGARLLCKAAEKHMGEFDRPENFVPMLGGTAMLSLAGVPNLGSDCLAATLGVVRLAGDSFKSMLVGDGVVAAKGRGGVWKVVEYSFLPGGTSGRPAPYYLWYTLADNVKGFLDAFGGVYKRAEYTGELLSGGGMVGVERTGSLDPERPYFLDEFPLAEYESVFVCTDGVSSFYRMVGGSCYKHGEPVPFLEVLRVLLDVNVGQVSCMRLQRHWAFKRKISGTFAGRGWNYADDVSAGIVASW